ncbi:MAG: hypothetical protein QOG51_1342 [Verrucomicrobiota bacterium]|jgi:hypothetical protein
MPPPLPPSQSTFLSAGRAFRAPFVAPDLPVREAPSVSFADLVRMMAEGIADAQTSLDHASASLLVELANTKVDIIPSVTETIAADGSISFQPAKPQTVSLLDIGVHPTFYQFSQATVEVAMDIKVVENETVTGEGKRRFALFADTSSVKFERKLNRDVKISSKISATLMPVPMPLRLEPVRTTSTPAPPP